MARQERVELLQELDRQLVTLAELDKLVQIAASRTRELFQASKPGVAPTAASPGSAIEEATQYGAEARELSLLVGAGLLLLGFLTGAATAFFHLARALPWVELSGHHGIWLALALVAGGVVFTRSYLPRTR